MIWVELVDNFYSNYEHWALLGDFNFDSERNFRIDDNHPLENLMLQKNMPQALDVWDVLHADKTSGKTFDNGMLPHEVVKPHNRLLSVPARDENTHPCPGHKAHPWCMCFVHSY